MNKGLLVKLMCFLAGLAMGAVPVLVSLERGLVPISDLASGKGFRLLEEKEPRAARDLFLLSLEMDEENPAACLGIAMIMENQGDLEIAKAWYERALSCSTGNAALGQDDRERVGMKIEKIAKRIQSGG